MDTIRVLLADDHAVVREGLKALVNAQSGMEVVAEADDGPSAVELTQRHDPDVVVVDISMPGMNGFKVTSRLRELNPERKILALTVHEDTSYLRLLLQAGAKGYVLKRAVVGELVQAIRTVAAGGTYLDPSLVGQVVRTLSHGSEVNPTVELSERESEVLQLIALGYSNKEIAARLKLSVKTVETYKNRSMEKLGVRTRVEIVRYAVKRGWLDDS
jgi:DNA-binding NarL/FixJ family response regulator